MSFRIRASDASTIVERGDGGNMEPRLESAGGREPARSGTCRSRGVRARRFVVFNYSINGSPPFNLRSGCGEQAAHRGKTQVDQGVQVVFRAADKRGRSAADGKRLDLVSGDLSVTGILERR